MEEGSTLNSSSIKRQKHSRTRSCVNCFNEFTTNTTLHGLKYVGEENISITERVWWAISFSLSFITCVYLIVQVWNKWQNIPVIVSFDEKPTPIWQMPFPAITICSESKSLQSKFNFTKYYHSDLDNMTSEERQKYDALLLVCTAINETRGHFTSDSSSIDIIKELSPSVEYMTFQCLWKSVKRECHTILNPILTDEGLCYSFNMLEASEIFREETTMYETLTNNSFKSDGWNLNDGYAKNIPLDTYPLRATESGAMKGFMISFQVVLEDLDYLCRGPVQGYKISLHTPAEIPRVSREYIRIPIGQEVLVAIKPNMLTTSDELIKYDPKKRHCYFAADRHLKFFKKYTKKSCDLECLSNYTLHVCGCVSFFMPRDSSMKICSTASTICVSKAEEELVTKDIKSEMAAYGMLDESDTDKDTRKGKERIASQCDCLAGCTSIDYDAETSQANFEWIKGAQSLTGTLSTKEKIDMAMVTVFFKHTEFIGSHRSELYGQIDFLANCGGLLGLFLGFSVLSLIEIIYFLTLRICCDITNKIHKEA